MKAHTEYLTFNTEERYEMVHITPEVEEIVRRSGIDDGLCFVSTKKSYYCNGSRQSSLR